MGSVPKKNQKKATKPARPPRKVRVVRDALGLSVRDLANIMGCSVMSVHRWEKDAAGADPAEKKNNMHAETLTFLHAQVTKRTRGACRAWGQKLLKARKRGFATFLLNLAIPPTAEADLGLVVAPIDAFVTQSPEVRLGLTARQQMILRLMIDKIGASRATPTRAEMLLALGVPDGPKLDDADEALVSLGEVLEKSVPAFVTVFSELSKLAVTVGLWEP